MALQTTFVQKKQETEGVARRSQGYIGGTYTAATVNQATAVSTAATGGGIADVRSVNDVVIAAGVMTITLGYMPRRVKVVNVTDRIQQEWFLGMNTGDFLETAANGTVSLETDDKLSVNATTGVITIAADGGAFTDNDTMIWFADA